MAKPLILDRQAMRREHRNRKLRAKAAFATAHSAAGNPALSARARVRIIRVLMDYESIKCNEDVRLWAVQSLRSDRKHIARIKSELDRLVQAWKPDSMTDREIASRMEAKGIDIATANSVLQAFQSSITEYAEKAANERPTPPGARTSPLGRLTLALADEMKPLPRKTAARLISHLVKEAGITDDPVDLLISRIEQRIRNNGIK